MMVYIKRILLTVGVMMVFALSATAAEHREYGAVRKKVFATNQIIKIDQYIKGKNTQILNLEIGKSVIAALPAEAEDVIVSDPTIISTIVRTGKQILFIGKGVGETNILFFLKGYSEPVSLEVKVDQDLEGLKTAIKRLVPKANIEVQIMRGNIVLTGIAPSNQSVGTISRLAGTWIKKGKLVNLITVKGKDQVQLKVRVVEMQRSLAKRLGLDLAGGFTTQTAVGSFANSNAFSVSGASQGQGGSFFKSAIDLTGKILGSPYKIVPEITLQALERVGIVRTLSEPTLITTSGEKANFLAGGEVPVPTGYDRDRNEVIVSYKEFGVGLEFTPVVLNNNRISINVSIKVSEIGTNSLSTGGVGLDKDGNLIQTTVSIPSFDTRRVGTTVEMPSGRSFVVAGLIKEETRKAIDSIPGLKNVKVLGELFRSRDFKNNQTELVVIVTPYLVNPVHPNDVAVPGEDFIARPQKISELSRLQEVYMTPGNTVDGQSLSGPYGFVIE